MLVSIQDTFIGLDELIEAAGSSLEVKSGGKQGWGETMGTCHLYVKRLCLMLLIIAGLTLAFMLVFTVFNVIMRAFGRPIVGDFEVISFLGAVVIGFALPYTSLRKGHVAVDFMAEKLAASSTGKWVEICTRILSIGLFMWLGWCFLDSGLDMIDTGEVTAVFRVPYYPISFGLAFSCLVQCFVLSLRVQELIGGEDE